MEGCDGLFSLFPNYHETILLHLTRWRLSPEIQTPDAGISAHRGHASSGSTSRRQLRDTAMPRHDPDGQPSDVLGGWSDPAARLHNAPSTLLTLRSAHRTMRGRLDIRGLRRRPRTRPDLRALPRFISGERQRIWRGGRWTLNKPTDDFPPLPASTC